MDGLAALSIRYPEIGNQVQALLAVKDEASAQNMRDTLAAVNLQPDKAKEILARRVAYLGERGIDDSHTRELMSLFDAEPDKARELAKLQWAVHDGERYTRYQQASSPKVLTGRYAYKPLPDGFLKVDTATGKEQRVRIGSKAFQQEEKARRAALDAAIAREGETFNRAKKLRDEFTGQSSTFVSVRDAFDRVEASVESPDAAGDLALIFNYMKMLDPGSVVREGEFATAQNAGSVPDSVINMYNRVWSGERLNPKQRKMFLSRATRLFRRAEKRNTSLRKDILGVGRRYGLKERDIFGESQETPVSAPGTTFTSPGGITFTVEE